MGIPAHIKAELLSYRQGNHPYPFGSFLTAVLANDLVGAVAKADDNNRRIISEYAAFLYNEMPSRTGSPTLDMWGSYAAVNHTIADQIAIEQERTG
jgi:hypothetical protein